MRENCGKVCWANCGWCLAPYMYYIHCICMGICILLQTWHLMQDAKYGDDEDQVGVLRLVQNNSFNGYFPLHEVS